MSSQPDLILASQSPRRQELLRQIGVRFAVNPSSIPEIPHSHESPRDYVTRLATAKAQAVRAGTDLPVLGADTVVVHQDQILEKPRGQEEGIAMLLKLGGAVHQVVTAVALISPRGASCIVCTTDVGFRAITPVEAARYWQTGEPADKAGGYAIQGLGAVFVNHLAGSYSNVVGLPLTETAQLLQKAGISIWNGDFARE